MSISRRPSARAAARLSVLLPAALTPAAFALAQSAVTLPAVTVRAADANPSPLAQPLATGSNLGLTPLETPASVETLTREQLEERGDSTLIDAITRATGISSMAHPGNGGSALAARGFTDTASVLQLYDGMRQYGGLGVTYPFDTWAIERIDVLRGPAAVLYGDGAIGGVVNVIPKKPTRGGVENEIQSTIGTQGKKALAFGSGGSIDHRVAYRFDVSADRSQGWVDRGDTRHLSVSGALLWDVTRDLQLQLSHAQGRQKPMRYFGTPLIEGAPVEALRERNYNVEDSKIRYRDRWTDLSARWSPDADTVVKSRLYVIQSDRYWRNAEGYGFNAATGLIDRSDNTEIAHDQTQVGNTTNATFKGRLAGRDNTFSLGFDVNTSTFRHTNNTYTGSSPSVDPYSPIPGYYSSAVPFIPRYENSADQYALFAEDRFAITDRWSLVGGVRYDHVTLERKNLIAGTQAFKRNYSNVGARIGTVYRLTQDTSLYAQFAKAADPVGSLLTLSPANSAYDLATGRQIEAGIKHAFLDGKGEWTLAAYEIRKNNLLTRDTANPALSQQVGERSSRGIESSLTLALGRTVRLDANVALLRARYDNFTESVGGVPISRNGKVPTDVPERLANLWLSWDVQPDWTLSGGLRHVGQRYADNANTLKLPAYTTADVAVQWRVQPATTLTLRGFNVFDKYYFTTAYYTNTQWFVGEGRRVELTLNHRF